VPVEPPGVDRGQVAGGIGGRGVASDDHDLRVGDPRRHREGFLDGGQHGRGDPTHVQVGEFLLGPFTAGRGTGCGAGGLALGKGVAGADHHDQAHLRPGRGRFTVDPDRFGLVVGERGLQRVEHRAGVVAGQRGPRGHFGGPLRLVVRRPGGLFRRDGCRERGVGAAFGLPAAVEVEPAELGQFPVLQPGQYRGRVHRFRPEIGGWHRLRERLQVQRGQPGLPGRQRLECVLGRLPAGLAL
jgi:hypothetical protein